MTGHATHQLNRFDQRVVESWRRHETAEPALSTVTPDPVSEPANLALLCSALLAQRLEIHPAIVAGGVRHKSRNIVCYPLS